MFIEDFWLTVFVTAQPVVLGVLLFITARVQVLARALHATQTGARRRLKGVRFFECAAYPRLLIRVRYTVSTLGFGVLFLIYDVDVLFFLAETVAWDRWAGLQAFLAAVYALFFAVALWLDARQTGLVWERQ